MENAGGAGPKLYVGKGRGKTLTTALNQIYDTVQRRIYWSHVRTYLFTESAIQAGGADYFDNLKDIVSLGIRRGYSARKDRLRKFLKHLLFFACLL